MKSRLSCAIAVSAMVLLATTVSAQTVLYSFEDGTTQGWGVADDAAATFSVGGGTGVTDGTNALRVAGTQGNESGGGFQRSAKVDLDATRLAQLNAAAATGGSLSFDMTIDRGDYPAALPFFKSQIAINTDDADGGWSQRDLQEGAFLPPGTEDPVFDPDGALVQTYHFVLPLNTDVFSGNPPNGGDGAASIFISSNTWDDLIPPGPSQERIYYLDNIAVTIIPEPTTLGSLFTLLLGGGFLARRRR